jgi:hypothetical protein
MSGTIPLFPNTPSWRGAQGHLYLIPFYRHHTIGGTSYPLVLYVINGHKAELRTSEIGVMEV